MWETFVFYCEVFGWFWWVLLIIAIIFLCWSASSYDKDEKNEIGKTKTSPKTNWLTLAFIIFLCLSILSILALIIS